MHASKTIITNQDPTVRRALEVVMLNTFQCLCQWHITHKMGDIIGRVYQDRNAMSRFHFMLNNLDHFL